MNILEGLKIFFGIISLSYATNNEEIHPEDFQLKERLRGSLDIAWSSQICGLDFMLNISAPESKSWVFN